MTNANGPMSLPVKRVESFNCLFMFMFSIGPKTAPACLPGWSISVAPLYHVKQYEQHAFYRNGGAVKALFVEYIHKNTTLLQARCMLFNGGV